jgi:hypothetical protein
LIALSCTKDGVEAEVREEKVSIILRKVLIEAKLSTWWSVKYAVRKNAGAPITLHLVGVFSAISFAICSFVFPSVLIPMVLAATINGSVVG